MINQAAIRSQLSLDLTDNSQQMNSSQLGSRLTHLHHGSISEDWSLSPRAVVGAVNDIRIFHGLIENLLFKTIGRQCYFANIASYILYDGGKKKKLFI